MSIYVNALVLLGVIAAVAGIILTLASKFMDVPVDETQLKLRECLPGANCGACGYIGCDDYAAALTTDPDNVSCSACIPGGAATAGKLAELLGKEAEAIEERVARVHCRGIDSKRLKDMECDFGCIACGKCIEACNYSAIELIDGVAVVNRSSCVGCGACAKDCPKNIISVAPAAARVFVGCSSLDKGADTRKACTAGCIGCGKCVKICKFDAIEVVDNRAVIDAEKCKNCGMCAKECPTKAIIVMPKQIVAQQ